MRSFGSRRALVLGLGRFGGGRAAAQHLARAGWDLRIADRADAGSLAESLRELDGLDRQLELRLGDDHAVDLLDDVDLLVVNPAIRPGHPLLREAEQRGVATTQEANLFIEEFPGRVVLVTGTNGKSTTATALADCLRRAGMPTRLGGNIGRSLLEDADHWRPEQTAVLEISSAQLARLDPRRHRVAGTVATRITRDHLDWHGSIDSYRAAKQRALEAATDFVVHAADDECAAGASTEARRITYSLDPPTEGQLGVDRAGWLRSALATDPGPLLHRDAITLVGGFHLENLAAAFAAAACLGVSRAIAGVALARVAPLRHRLQLTGTAGGRRIYDNAVSTEVQSTLSALGALDGAVHWVGGGKSKDGDIAGVAAKLAPHLASAHAFGAAADELYRVLATTVPATRHQTVEAALDAAWAQAGPGESVLFSPAFASFDQFANFRERALRFESWARRAIAGTPGSHGGLPDADDDR